MYKGYPTEVRSSRARQVNRPFSQQKECKEISTKCKVQSCERPYISTILKGAYPSKQTCKVKPTHLKFSCNYPQPQSLQTTYRYNQYAQSPYVKQQQQLYELQKTIMADNKIGVSQFQQTNHVNQMAKQITKKPKKSTEHVTQSLNGSFELKKRILTTDALQNQKKDNQNIVNKSRAQSMMDEYKTTAIELQQTMKMPEPIIQQRMIPYDSETEFEGYRKGEFLTIASDEDEQDPAQRQHDLEHFLKNLSDKEVLLLEKYIYLRKYDMMTRQKQQTRSTKK